MVEQEKERILKEIEGLEAKMRWDHATPAQISFWKTRIEALRKMLNDG